MKSGKAHVARLMVFSGNANPELANQIARQLGVALGKANVSMFSDGEINIEIHDNVRGNDVFIVQPTCAPTNRNLMELVLMIDAMRRAPKWLLTCSQTQASIAF